MAFYSKYTRSLTSENFLKATEPSGEDGEGDPTAMVEMNIILQVSLTPLFVNIRSLLKLNMRSLLTLEDVYFSCLLTLIIGSRLTRIIMSLFTIDIRSLLTRINNSLFKLVISFETFHGVSFDN